MKKLFIQILVILSFSHLFADIAPSPIIVNSIYTVNDCQIQMTNEHVFADLYKDSAKVECTFNLECFGDPVTIQIGFPEMNFHYWSMSEYTPTDKGNFKIFVDGKLLNENDIQVPPEMDNIYQKYMSVYFYDNEYQRKRDSINNANGVHVKKNKKIYPPGSYDKTRIALDELYQWRDSKPRIGSELWGELNDQKQKGNFPWYVWYVRFEKQEKKQIKVVYSLPSGLGYGSDYRYFKYILATGAGWYKTIEKAEVQLQLHDIDIKTIEEISPKNHSLDTTQKTISWTFIDLEPTSKDDIYVRYFDTEERKQREKYKRKIERANEAR